MAARFVYSTSEGCSACEQVREFLQDKFAVDIAEIFTNVDKSEVLGRTGVLHLNADGSVLYHYKSPHQIAELLQVLGHIESHVKISRDLTMEFLQYQDLA